MRFEWLQKHPTPRTAGGDFHWYPGVVDADLRAEIAAGATGEVTVWIGGGPLVVARAFREIAPGDGRAYTGLACVIGGADAPPARPWSEDPVALGAARCLANDGAASAIWEGGPCREADAALLVELDGWLPAEVRARRRRVVIDPAAPETVRGAGRWLLRAVRTRAQKPWQAALARARLERRGLADLLDELDAIEHAWRDAAELRAYLAGAGIRVPARDAVDGDGAHQWGRILHAWSRGRVVVARERLVAVIARRALCDRAWREAIRYHALLPAAVAEDLIEACDA